MNRAAKLAIVTALGLVLGALPLSVAHAAVFSNDDFVNAEAISEASGTTYGSTVDATAETGEPANHVGWTSWGTDLGGQSIWYAWTAPVDVGDTTFVVESDFGGQALGVYTGTSVDALTEIDYNTYAPLDGLERRARVDFTPTAGETYVIGVGDSSGSGQSVTLSWEPSGSPPANDDFATAPALPASDTGSTEWATWESGEPTVLEPEAMSDLGGRTVWYTYAPAQDGVVWISLEGSSFDTVLGVYTGSLGSLTMREFNDDYIGYDSALSFFAEAGTVYHVGIGGYGELWGDSTELIQWGDSGEYALDVDFLPVTPAAPSAVHGDGEVALSWTAPSDGGSSITGYSVAYRASTEGTWTVVRPDPLTATAMTITGLTNGATYYFQVMASNAYGDSAYSAIETAVPSTTPGVPEVVGVDTDSGSLTLDWIAPSDGGSPLTSYTIAYRPVGDVDWRTVTFDAPATSWTITGLLNGAEFEMKVLATNDNGDGDYSDVVSWVVGLPPDAPEAPLVTSTASGTATLTWVDGSNNGSEIDGYEVCAYIFKKGTKNKPATYTLLDGYPYATGMSNTYTVTGLMKKYTYVFTVRAHNVVGWSPLSDYSLPFRG